MSAELSTEKFSEVTRCMFARKKVKRGSFSFIIETVVAELSPIF
jgi:hypothetical protein